MATDIERAFTAISGKKSLLTSLYNYVNGPQPLRYSTERLKDAFDDIKVHFEINWCSVIVSSVNDRLELTGFDVQKDKKASTWLSGQFEALQILGESQKVHKAALGYTQGFVIVWKNAAGEIEFYYNDPRLCEVFYDPNSPKKKVFAAKWFEVPGENAQEILLYYPDRLEHWRATVGKDGIVSGYGKFVKVSEEINAYGVIPVFEFFTDGEITGVTTLQDAVNKVFSDMMVAGEFGAFVQRYIISQADPGDLKSGASVTWWIPAGDSSGQGSAVGQFAPTPMAPYLEAMDRLASAMFVITHTPKHYLMSTGATPSGEALIAMEAPLTKKVDWYKKRFETSWKEIAKFILQLGDYTVDISGIIATWKRSESTQPYTEAQTQQVMVNTGMPLTAVLRRSGWSETEIKALLDDIQKEKEAKQTLAQAVLDSLRNKTAQGNPDPNPPPDNTGGL